MYPYLRVVFGVPLLILLTCASAFAQQASIIGTVKDQTEAVLPGVTVTAVNLANGQQTVAVTGEEGDYRLQNLPPGRYNVTADLQGFSRVSIPDVELLLGQNVTLPVTLRKLDGVG